MSHVTLYENAAAELNALFRAAVDNQDIPNAVAVVANRKHVLFRGAVGVAASSIYRIASMTKPVTSVAIMMLKERGLLDLDDPVELFLPEFANRQVIQRAGSHKDSIIMRPAKNVITLRHLLAHTAGLGYDFCSDTVYVLCKDESRQPRSLPLLNDPGSLWTYGCATQILGEVIEKVTGESFITFQQTQILQPLGMNDTDYFLRPDDQDRLVPLYHREGGGLVSDGNAGSFTPYLFADGGLIGTADDYIRFLQMLLNDGKLGDVQLLTKQSVGEMITNQIGELTVETQASPKPAVSQPFPLGAGEDKFGLGFQLKASTQTDLRSPGSYSWAGLFNTHFWADPHIGIAAVLLTQLLPFYDDRCIKLLCDFERVIYKNLRQA